MKTPAQTAGVRNAVILCVIYYGIRPAGVVTGKPGDTRLLCPGIAFLWSQLIYRAEPKKLPKKVSKRVLREGGKSAIITEYTVQAGSARPEA